LTACASKIAGDSNDFADEFSNGDIVIPAGTVFDYAGHAFGPASDPLDASHEITGGTGWQGVSKEEALRRSDLMGQDLRTEQKHSSAVITLQAARLTKAKFCAIVPAAAAESSEWGWTQTPVFGQPETYFQAYGVMNGGGLSTDFANDKDPFQHAAARGEINGILDGTTSRTIKIK
jgi:hypothetical protein